MATAGITPEAWASRMPSSPMPQPARAIADEALMYGPGSRAERFPAGIRALTREDLALYGSVGQRVDDCNGKRLGTVLAILVARGTGGNRFLMVRSRSGKSHAVPLTGLVFGGGRVWTPQTARMVDASTALPEHGVLTARQEAELVRRYGEPAPVRPQTWERRATIARARLGPDGTSILWSPGPR